MDPRTPGSVMSMSQFDTPAEGFPKDRQAVPGFASQDDVPAARLLAHDLEPLVWEDDGEGVLPPPD
jgi:hypothetical protein